MKSIPILGIILVTLTACSDPLTKPAKAKQLESFKTILEMYPELKDDYLQAESNGIVTKGELMEIIDKVGIIKSERDSK